MIIRNILPGDHLWMINNGIEGILSKDKQLRQFYSHHWLGQFSLPFVRFYLLLYLFFKNPKGWTIEVDGHPCGYLYYHLWDGVNELSLQINLEHRGKGYGKQLVLHGIKNRDKTLQYYIEPETKELCTWYHSYGITILDEDTNTLTIPRTE